MHLAEVGLLGGPVVHLHVDVGVDVGVPGGVIHVAPDTLQVVREVHTARRADFEIASVSEVKLFEHQGVGSVAAVVGVDKHVRGHGVGSAVEVEAHAVPVFLEVVEVAAVQVTVALCGSRIHAVAEVGGELIRAAGIGRGVRIEVRSTGNDHHHVARAAHGYALFSRGDSSFGVEVDHLEAEGILDGLGFTVERVAREEARSVVVGSRASKHIAALQREAEVERGCTRGGVLSHHHIVGIGSEVLAFVARCALRALELHETGGLGQVQAAHIVRCALFRAEREVVAEVLNEHGAEVFVLSVVGTHVGGASAPEGLLVDLDFVAHHAAEEAGAELSVTDGERPLHPVAVALAAGIETGGGGRLGVPEGEFLGGLVSFGTGHLVVGIAHLAHGHELDGVATVAGTPNGN